MTDRDENLSPATTEDVADALAFALRFHGRKRVNSAYEYMAQITAERLCEGFTVLRGRNINCIFAINKGATKKGN